MSKLKQDAELAKVNTDTSNILKKIKQKSSWRKWLVKGK